MTARARLLYLCLETLDADRAVHTHVYGLVEALRRHGWEVEVIAAQGQRGRGLGLLRQFARYGALNFKAILRLRACDAVYVRSHFAALPLALAARLMGRGVFHEINGVPDDLGVTYPRLAPALGLLRWLYRAQYRRATHLFAVTEGLAAFARALSGHARVTTAPNGVDPVLFSPEARRRPAAAPQGTYALFYGDVAQWHGLDVMFAALRDTAWPSDVSLLLIGRGSAAEGPLAPPDLAGRVVWLDRMAQIELLPFIVNARFGLCPITDPGGRSATGVMPLKLLEMMACGLPVIVTELPGQAELVGQTGCGLVVPPGDAGALAKAVAALAADVDAPTLGQRGRAAVLAAYSWDAVAAQTAAVMERQPPPPA